MTKKKTYPWMLNCISSRNQEEDWQDADVLQPDAAQPFTRKRVLPEVDLRKGADWWTIGNQKKTGACVGWTVGDGLIRYQMVKAELLEPATKLSVRYLWMAAKETDSYVTRPTSFIESSGTYLKAALKIAQKYGVVEEEVLPTFKATFYAGSAGKLYTIAARRRIASYINLGTPGEKWKEWLSKGCPVATRLDCDEAWMSCGRNGRLDSYDGDETFGGHAAAVVGYNEYGWIIRNSWGTAWGHKGYAYVSYPYADGAFTEGYGAVV